MAKNIEETLIYRIQNGQFFSLQVDESTAIAENADLMCFIRYDYKGSIQNHFQEEQRMTKFLTLSFILLFKVALTGKNVLD
jgi:hypothetical protein